MLFQVFSFFVQLLGFPFQDFIVLESLAELLEECGVSFLLAIEESLFIDIDFVVHGFKMFIKVAMELDGNYLSIFIDREY